LEQILSPLLRKGFLGTLLITQNYTMQENITLRHQYHLWQKLAMVISLKTLWKALLWSDKTTNIVLMTFVRQYRKKLMRDIAIQEIKWCKSQWKIG